MPYLTFESFKEAATRALRHYANEYTIFKPTHYTLAVSTIIRISTTENRASLIGVLYGVYQNLLRTTHSKGLFNAVATVLATELVVPNEVLFPYLKEREKSNLTTKALRLIPHASDPVRYFDSRIGRDPIHTAVERRGQNDPDNPVSEYTGPGYVVTERDGRSFRI